MYMHKQTQMNGILSATTLTNSSWRLVCLWRPFMSTTRTYLRLCYCTCPKKMRDPPARNRPASCVNFNPKWGSYNARRIVTLAIVQSITICEPNLVIRYRANTSTLNHWLNTLLNILKIVVCECACIYICSANLALYKYWTFTLSQ